MDIIAEGDDIYSKRESPKKDASANESNKNPPLPAQPGDSTETPDRADFFPETGPDALQVGLIGQHGLDADHSQPLGGPDRSPPPHEKEIRSYLNLSLERLIVGSATDCDISINDSSISRHHALLTRQGSELWIEDLDSASGTRVNGEAVTKRRLNDDDHLLIGNYGFRFLDRKRPDRPGRERALVAAANDELRDAAPISDELQVRPPDLEQLPNPEAHGAAAAEPETSAGKTGVAPAAREEDSGSPGAAPVTASAADSSREAPPLGQHAANSVSQPPQPMAQERSRRAGLGLAAAAAAAILSFAYLFTTERWAFTPVSVETAPATADAEPPGPTDDASSEVIGAGPGTEPTTEKTSSVGELGGAPAESRQADFDFRPDAGSLADAGPKPDDPRTQPVAEPEQDTRPEQPGTEDEPALAATGASGPPSVDSPSATDSTAGGDTDPSEPLGAQRVPGSVVARGAPHANAKISATSKQVAETEGAVAADSISSGISAGSEGEVRTPEDAAPQTLPAEAEEADGQPAIATQSADTAGPAASEARPAAATAASAPLVLALLRLQEGNPEESLHLAEKGLAAAPDDDGLRAVKEEAQRRLDEQTRNEARLAQQTKMLLAEAEDHRENLRLTTPSGNNAYETLKRVLELDPENEPAKAELAKIANDYLELAQQSGAGGRWSQSLTYVKRGLKVAPSHQGLLAFQGEAAKKAATARSKPTQRREKAGSSSRTAQTSRSKKVSPKRQQPVSKRATREAGRFVAGIQAKARLRKNQGRIEESRVLVETGLRLAPGHPGLRQLKKELQ